MKINKSLFIHNLNLHVVAKTSYISFLKLATTIQFIQIDTQNGDSVSIRKIALRSENIYNEVSYGLLC